MYNKMSNVLGKNHWLESGGVCSIGAVLARELFGASATCLVGAPFYSERDYEDALNTLENESDDEDAFDTYA